MRGDYLKRVENRYGERESINIDIAIIMMLGALSWLVGTTVGMVMLAVCFQKEVRHTGNGALQ